MLKVGTVGGGHILEHRHLPVLKKLDNLDVIAICDIQEDVALTLCRYDPDADCFSTVSSDSNGNYIINGITNGDYKVWPGKEGYTFSPNNHSVRVSGEDETGVDFTAIAD